MEQQTPHNLQNDKQLLALQTLKSPYLLLLKEEGLSWKNENLESKELTIEFILNLLNIKVSDEISEDSLNIQLALVNSLINDFFGKLTKEEIKEAFKMYVARKFPDIKVFRMIDCVSVSEVLNAYIEYRDKSIAPFIEKRKILLNAPKEKTEAEKQQIFKDFVTMVYNEIKENEYSSDAWQLFSILESCGVINISDDEKKLMYKKELALYVPNERNKIKLQNPINYKSAISDFEKTYMNGNKSTYVKNRCRSILVSKFIHDNIKSLDELIYVLNQKK